MTNKQYGIKNETPRSKLPGKQLAIICHEGQPLATAKFGSGSYEECLEEMSKHYYNSEEYPNITFRPANTVESLEIGAQEPRFYSVPILCGKIVRTKDGIFINSTNTHEDILTDKRNKKVNGIWLLDYFKDNVAFAPYETFNNYGTESLMEFLRGGLARALEYTDAEVAENFSKLTAYYNPQFVSVDLERVTEPTPGIIRITIYPLDNYPKDRFNNHAMTVCDEKHPAFQTKGRTIGIER